MQTIDRKEYNDQLTKLQLKIEFYEKRNKELEDQVVLLKKEPTDSEFEYYGGLSYYQVEEKETVRFIVDELELRALPYNGAAVLRTIEVNTQVEVLDKVSVNNEIENGRLWYYVAIPVYDTPMDYKGWIKVEDTVEYNEENYRELQSEVNVIIGAEIIESFEFPNFDGTDYSYMLEYELGGRLDERRDGYARLLCAGGMSCWVSEKDIRYPEFP